MADVQINGASLTTTSATTAPAAGTTETWTVTALTSKFGTLKNGDTYALVDATSGSSQAQQDEIVRVVSGSGVGSTSITVIRGADGTTPVAHSATATFNVIMTASWLNARPTLPDVDQWGIYLYGASYAILSGAAYYTSGNHYSEQVAADINAAAPTSYAVSSRRILDVCATVVNGTNITGTTGVIAAGKWTSTSARGGLVIVDVVNDIGHYPAMNVSPVVPATIPTANTKYLDGMTSMYRCALAIMSSESRVEQSSATFGGTWTATASAAAYASGGTVAYTTTVGAYADYSVTPPQSGPLAGKVFHLCYKLDASVAPMAATTYSVDGTAAFTYQPTSWEQYVGHNGATANVAYDMVAITLPIDGAAHTVRVAHAGVAGQYLYSDAIIVPSERPNPIFVMGTENTPIVHTGVFDAAGVNAWRYNLPLVTRTIKAVVSEFPNSTYVPSTMTTNGLYSGDGLHPNDRGMSQRANDLLNAVQLAKPLFVSRVLSDLADSRFGVI